MIKNILLLFALMVLIASLSPLYGQVDTTLNKHSIQVIARPYKDSITLRWAPSTAVSWELLNKYGYKVVRYTLTRDKAILENRPMVELTSGPILPKPMKNWEKAFKINDYVAIAAQSIYGETFEIKDMKSAGIMEIINKSKELESRYSFAILAADMSIEAAELSGLRFTDKSTKPNEKYVYRVYSLVPEKNLNIDFGYTFTGAEDHRPLPEIIKPSARFSDKAVILSWEAHLYKDIFTSYIIERSDDGGITFHRKTEAPFVNTRPENIKESRLMFKQDSLPQNDKVFVYRIRGIDAFGEISEPSDTVSGKGKDLVRVTAAISSADVIDNKLVKLSWDITFYSEKQPTIEGFFVERTDKADGKFEVINKARLAKEVRTFIDTSPFNTNYYRVRGVDNHGASFTSFPHLVQLIDSIPPSEPTGLAGKCDSLGVITLSWKQNKEADLFGYRVYRANHGNEEYTQITTKAIKDTAITDTISINTLSKNIYYQVVAVDTRYNPSNFSKSLTIKRPDIIPPVSPVFTKVKSSEEGIDLEWANSSSNDVVKHLLYKRQSGEGDWVLLASNKAIDSVSAYKDLKVELSKSYEYTLVAVDDSGLESVPAKPVKAKKIDSGIRPAIGKVNSIVDRERNQVTLSWKYKSTEVEKFLIYRSIEQEPLSIYHSTGGREGEFKDQRLTVNTRYTYTIKAVFKDGSQSPFSEELKIDY